MDEIENLEAQISYLQEDIGQRLHLLNEDQSTEQFKDSSDTLYIVFLAYTVGQCCAFSAPMRRTCAFYARTYY
jgi:hypothetical protein